MHHPQTVNEHAKTSQLGSGSNFKQLYQDGSMGAHLSHTLMHQKNNLSEIPMTSEGFSFQIVRESFTSKGPPNHRCTQEVQVRAVRTHHSVSEICVPASQMFKPAFSHLTNLSLDKVIVFPSLLPVLPNGFH